MGPTYTTTRNSKKTRGEGGTMADKERLRRQNARLKAEIETMKPVVDAAIDLVRSGYDGPFMGDGIAPLLEAVTNHEKNTGVRKAASTLPMKIDCRAPQGGCVSRNGCGLAGKCLYRPDESGHLTND